MKIEEAIERFEREIRENENIIRTVGAFNSKGLSNTNEICKMAIEALKEKLATEKNEPLTLEDLKQLESGPIYVVPLDPQLVKNGWQEWCVWWAKDEQAMVPGIEYTSWHLADYGTKWIAYRQEPKEENHG